MSLPAPISILDGVDAYTTTSDGESDNPLLTTNGITVTHMAFVVTSVQGKKIAQVRLKDNYTIPWDAFEVTDKRPVAMRPSDMVALYIDFTDLAEREYAYYLKERPELAMYATLSVWTGGWQIEAWGLHYWGSTYAEACEALQLWLAEIREGERRNGVTKD